MRATRATAAIKWVSYTSFIKPPAAPRPARRPLLPEFTALEKYRAAQLANGVGTGTERGTARPAVAESVGVAPAAPITAPPL